MLFCRCRKIVLATNIAESSITIDDVVYVIDCGKAKETSYDALNKLACLLPSWISKASAHQVEVLELVLMIRVFLFFNFLLCGTCNTSEADQLSFPFSLNLLVTNFF